MQTGSVSAAEGKALSMLGMSLKAGRLALGESAARKALLSGKAELVIFASDCADNTIDEVLFTLFTNKADW